ncbi:MAG: PilZ domain-containing protein [Demequinaceae bacterium]|nr:PilZ domain-containing protein [Demequinaceae bacterium]
MNHRKFTRVNPHLPIDVVADGRTVSGEVRDVGFEGVWVPAEVPLSERTPCRVTIHLAESIKICADGVVVRSEPDGFAVQFVELLDLESYGHLRNLILYNSRDTDTVEQEFDRHVQRLSGDGSISLSE